LIKYLSATGDILSSLPCVPRVVGPFIVCISTSKDDCQSAFSAEINPLLKISHESCLLDIDPSMKDLTRSDAGHFAKEPG